MSEFYIGLMSGTSLDGIDALLVSFPQPDESGAMQVLAHSFKPFDPELKSALLALNSPQANELHLAAVAGNRVASGYAERVRELLQIAGKSAQDIKAIGAHGQTIRHCPGQQGGYTIQLLNGAMLAELSGISVICDLRSRDVAAGGQGAPLVPAFHREQFGQDGRDLAVLNIGGISNISLLGQDGKTMGFDCGPGNCLMDDWILARQGLAYDTGGAWAATGEVLPELLNALLAEPFFALPPPRSTGRDQFNLAWLAPQLHASFRPQDVQATLLELSARSIANSLQGFGQGNAELLVCGGGALNLRLMQRLQDLLPNLTVWPTDSRGLPVMQVEAAAFAWLSMRFMRRLPGNLPAVTGAKGPRILGALYPA